MNSLIPLVVYLAICYAIGYLGKNRKFGFWGYAIAALILSPLIGFILLLASDERPPDPRCGCPPHRRA